MSNKCKNTVVISIPLSQDVVSAAIDLHKIAFVYAGKIKNTKQYTSQRRIHVQFRVKKRLDEFLKHLKRLPFLSKNIEIWLFQK